MVIDKFVIKSPMEFAIAKMVMPMIASSKSKISPYSYIINYAYQGLENNNYAICDEVNPSD